MSTELVKMSQPEMMEIAQLFAESKMFKDVSAIAQAFVKIQAGKEIGIAPFAAMTGINIIMGKLTISAGLMAGCVKGSGKYDYKVVKLDDTICSIDFYKGTKLEGNSTFTVADATKAGTQNMAKYPRNMLFARAMSNGQKWYCPDVFTMPVYTPEDFDIKTEDVAHEEQPNTGAVATPAIVITKKKLPLASYNTLLGKLENNVGTVQVVKDNFDLTEIQVTGLEAAAKKGEELKSAIDNLSIATTEQDLTDFNAQLPAYIVSNAAFTTASGKRLEVIMAEKPKPEATT